MRGISRSKQKPPLRGNKGFSSQHVTLFVHGVGVGSGPGAGLAFLVLLYRAEHVTQCRCSHVLVRKSKKTWEPWDESSCHWPLSPR